MSCWLCGRLHVNAVHISVGGSGFALLDGRRPHTHTQTHTSEQCLQTERNGSFVYLTEAAGKACLVSADFVSIPSSQFLTSFMFVLIEGSTCVERPGGIKHF